MSSNMVTKVQVKLRRVNSVKKAKKVTINKKLNILILSGDKEKVMKDLESLQNLLRVTSILVKKPVGIQEYFSRGNSSKDIQKLIKSFPTVDLKLTDIFDDVKGNSTIPRLLHTLISAFLFSAHFSDKSHRLVRSICHSIFVNF